METGQKNNVRVDKNSIKTRDEKGQDGATKVLRESEV